MHDDVKVPGCAVCHRLISDRDFWCFHTAEGLRQPIYWQHSPEASTSNAPGPIVRFFCNALCSSIGHGSKYQPLPGA